MTSGLSGPLSRPTGRAVTVGVIRNAVQLRDSTASSEMLRSLVGSEMCIRDRPPTAQNCSQLPDRISQYNCGLTVRNKRICYVML